MTWEIEDNGDGTFDVRNDGRTVRYDEDDLELAAQIVRRGGGESFTLIEPDGYRTVHPV